MAFTNEERATLRVVLRYEFHGILYLELRYARDGDPPGTIRMQRVAGHQVYADPQPGDAIVLRSLMGMVHEVAKAPASA